MIDNIADTHTHPLSLKFVTHSSMQLSFVENFARCFNFEFSLNVTPLLALKEDDNILKFHIYKLFFLLL